MQPASTSGVPVRRGMGGLSLGCVFLFMLPFFVFGIIAVVSSLNVMHHGAPLQRWLPPFIFGIVFSAMAVGICVPAVMGVRTIGESMALRQLHPGQPWMWRKEWEGGVFRDQRPVEGIGLAIFGLVWNLVVSIFVIAILKQPSTPFPMIAFVMVFVAIGLIILIHAVYSLLRNWKYGASSCRLNDLPVRPGHSFSGEVQTRITQPPENGFVMKLSCVRVTHSGRNTRETVLWTSEQTVGSGAAAPGPNGYSAPFTFTLPDDALATDRESIGATILWRLDVTAEEPGIDYASRFELPVFRI